MNVDKSVINSILANQDYAKLLSAVLVDGGSTAAKRVANWIASNLSVDESSSKTYNADVADLLALCDMADNNQISSNAATELFNALMNGASDPRQLAEARGLLQNSDEAAILEVVDAVIADPASQKAIEDIKNGNDKAVGYLVGQVMKQSKGQANPGLAQKLIKRRLV